MLRYTTCGILPCSCSTFSTHGFCLYLIAHGSYILQHRLMPNAGNPDIATTAEHALYLRPAVGNLVVRTLDGVEFTSILPVLRRFSCLPGRVYSSRALLSPTSHIVRSSWYTRRRPAQFAPNASYISLRTLPLGCLQGIITAGRKDSISG